MRELSPFYIPFIPAKYYASLLPSYAYLLMVCCAPIVVWDQTTIGLGCEQLLVYYSNKQLFAFKPLLLHPRMTIGLHHVPISLYDRHQPFVPFIPPPSGPLPRSTPSFFTYEIAHHLTESEIFFARCKCLAYGKMNATQRVLLRNILREDLVCIQFLLYLCNRKRETNRLEEELTRARVAEEGKERRQRRRYK